MKRIQIKRKSIFQGTVVGFLFTCILLNSSYGYLLQNDAPALVSLFAISAYCILYFGIFRKELFRIRFWKTPVILLALWIAVAIIIHQDFSRWGSYLRQILLFVTMTLIAEHIDYRRAARVFVGFMKYATLIAIAAWFVIHICKIHLPLPVIKANSDIVYYPFYYNGIVFFVNTWHTGRLMGPFWEGGIYACIAIMALITQELVRTEPARKQKWTTLILIAGIVLSFSTTGYLMLMLFYIFKTIHNSGSSKAILISAFVFLGAFILLVFGDKIVMLLASILPKVFGKLTYRNASSLTRFLGPVVDLEVFMHNPVIGVGLYKYENLWQKYALQYQVESRTSSLTYFLGNFGIPGILYGYQIICGVIKQKKLKLVCKVILVVIQIGMLTTAPYYLNLISLCFIAYIYRHQVVSACRKDDCNEEAVLSRAP